MTPTEDIMHDSGTNDFDRNDGSIEALLRRYRPVDPPAELRTRILASLREPPVRRAWPWMAAAAALLALTLASHAAVGRETAKADPAMRPAAETRARAADELTEMLGGDDDARRLAEFILVQQAVRRELTADTSRATTSTSIEGAWP
jgi:hypothetical protein